MATMTHDTLGSSRDRTASGLGFAVTSATSFSLSGPLGSGLMAAGWSAAAAVAARVLLAGVVLTPLAVVQLRGQWSVLRRNLGRVLAYGLIAVAGCQLAYFSAVSYLQVGVALLIEYTAPVLVVGWLWVRRGHRPGRLTVAGALLGVAGLLLVLDVVSGIDVSTVGVVWALASMVGGAVYFVMSGDDTTGLPGPVLAAGGLLVGGIALLLAGAVGIVPLATSTRPVAFVGFTVAWWVPVLALGVVTAALAYVSGIAASRALGSRLASFVALMEVVAALLFSWALLGQVPGAVQVLGGLLILGGVVLVKLGERTTTIA